MRKQHLMTIFKKIHDTIPSKDFLITFRTSEQYFTRKRKMTFVGIITFITNFYLNLFKPNLIDTLNKRTMRGGALNKLFQRLVKRLNPKPLNIYLKLR